VLYLIDASVFVWRAYHSVPIALVDPDGNPVNALHGFARFLGDLIERVRPRHLAVAFDAQLADSFRARLFPAYKANRDPAPQELKRQFVLCRYICEALGVTTYTSHQYEADDIVGTLATRMRAAGQNVTLVTRDKDLAQLIRPGDEYWDYTTRSPSASACSRSVWPVSSPLPATLATTFRVCRALVARRRRCCSVTSNPSRICTRT
jgi:DNA polymerase I